VELGNNCMRVNLNAISSGTDCRTTLMIKNFPNKFTQSVLRSEIATFSDGRYDFYICRLIL